MKKPHQKIAYLSRISVISDIFPYCPTAKIRGMPPPENKNQFSENICPTCVWVSAPTRNSKRETITFFNHPTYKDCFS